MATPIPQSPVSVNSDLRLIPGEWSQAAEGVARDLEGRGSEGVRSHDYLAESLLGVSQRVVYDLV